MGYLHIDNLYKNQDVLMFKECYAMEKVHGTSAHILFKGGHLSFFSGGCAHETFTRLFDQPFLEEKLLGLGEVCIYGEAYGGKILKQSHRYGKDIKFVAFDVKIDDNWLSVPQAHSIVVDLHLDFVDYVRIPTTIDEIDKQRDRPSVQAEKNGMGCQTREGVVLRPIIELTKNNRSRIISKHKTTEFMETKTERRVCEGEQKALIDAISVADEWVTSMRLYNILGKMQEPSMSDMREIIHRMCEDIKREGEGEMVWSKAVEKAVGRATATLTKNHFESKLYE